MEEENMPTPCDSEPEFVEKSKELMPKEDSLSAKICIIRESDLRNDPIHQAAKLYCKEVNFSKNGLELNDPATVFIVEDFESVAFDQLNKKKCRILGPTALIQLAEAKEPFPNRRLHPHFCLHMKGAIVCFTGFRVKKDLMQIIKEIHSMGGTFRREMSSCVTHLVANYCSGDKYRYAITFGVPVVGAQWVHTAWHERLNLAAKPALDPEIVSKFLLKPFFGARINLYGFPEEERLHMEKVLIENSGNLCTLEDPTCTHVVVDSMSTEGVGPDSALLPPHCHVVKAEWFWLSVQKESCADEAKHILKEEQPCDTTPLTSTPLAPYSSSARARKRKRLRFQTRDSGCSSSSEQVETFSPAGTKRRSSSLVVDTPGGGLARLSLSGSFLDSTASPDASCSVPDHATTPTCLTPGAPLAPPPSRRQMVFYELVQTETNYVDILHTIMTLFKEPLESKDGESAGLLNPTELKIIFGNLPPIYEVHRDMLAELRHASASWKDDTTQVGAILLKYKNAMLKAYPPFINFFEDTKKMLALCDESKPRFHAFLKIRMSRPECGRQNLSELLIRPVQRLPSISLLLNDLLKQTLRSNPDHDMLHEALQEIKSVMTLINEDKRKTEGQLAMFDIFNDIENCPADLVSSHRTFVQRCDVVELSSELSGRGDNLALFLFTDVLEVCKKRSKAFGSLRSPSVTSLHSSKLPAMKSYKHVKLLPLPNIKRILEIKETEDCHNAFALRCRSNQEYKERDFMFSINSEDVNKNSFLRTLSRQLANCVCRTDAESFLSQLDPAQLDLESSDVSTGTLNKAFNKFATRTKKKVGRAFSFNKTPNKLKRAVSTMLSPFGNSLNNMTPSSQLEQMRLASCTSLASVASLAELGTPRTIAESLDPPLSVQPIRKNKNPNGTLHRY
ncbi:hypothetical protein B566_EDAN004437 [Ephemera danica]|nr:hypothetical protein B566_EDAN004437 [Ephemera danica]